MEDRGWITIHRKIQDWELYFSEPFTRTQAWIDLLILANHAPKTINVRGNLIRVKRGQLAWSEETLSKRWKWSRNRVRRFLFWLKTAQQIDQEKSAVLSKIIILNYDEYQRRDTTDETTERQQTKQQTDTNNNVNNENNVNNDTIDRQKTPRDNAKSFFTEQSVQSEIVGRLEERGILDAAQEVSRFVSYWSELTLDGKKQRWETERTFEVDRRLTTWFSRKKQNSPIKPSQQWHVIE